MRVLKDDNGDFYVDDEPMRLEGEAAQKFVEDMDSYQETEERKKFLAECDRIYEAHRDK